MGAYHGVRGKYHSIQQAVNAAHKGDWILVGPGDYHERNDLENPPKPGSDIPPSAVLVRTPDLHIRGMSRNRTIVDGTKPNAAKPCSDAEKSQDYGAKRNGSAMGRNGIVVWKTDDVTIQNLTACNFLSGSASSGNEIWWNGGDGSGQLGLGKYRGAYLGSYLTATSMYGPKLSATAPLAQYGIFVSNARGPGLITHSYSSNMADAAYYVGACQQVCHAVLSRDRGTNSALGYSGTNAGGRLVIRHSRFDHNRTGLAPNSLNNDDAPPPQNGLCPGTTTSCLVIENNLIDDNNNANAPTEGLTTAVGAGVEISGGMFDTVRNNVIRNQGSWGIVTHDYPDPEKPPPGSHCQGGFPNIPGPGFCLFPARGNKIYGNSLIHDGFFGNPTNGDLATEPLIAKSPTPRNCFFDNTAPGGTLTSAPAHIERASVDGPPCGKRGTGFSQALFNQLICATGFLPCTIKHAHYPKQTKIIIVPLPRLRTMPHPCADVPRNAFC